MERLAAWIWIQWKDSEKDRKYLIIGMNSFNVYYKNNNTSKTHLKAYLPTLFHPHQIPTLYPPPHPSSEYQSSAAEENDDFDNEAEESYIASSVALLNRLRESIPPLATQIDQQQLDDNLNPELFIELVRQYPCIWNVRLNVYRDQSKKKVAWDEIKNVLDGNFTGRFVYIVFKL